MARCPSQKVLEGSRHRPPAVVVYLFGSQSCNSAQSGYGVGMNDPEGAAETVRVPVTEAARRGVSWLAELARDRRVLLTRFGRVAAVVDSPDRFDDTAATIDRARRTVVERYADTAATRARRRSLDDACAELGLDPQRVQARAKELRERARA